MGSIIWSFLNIYILEQVILAVSLFLLLFLIFGLFDFGGFVHFMFLAWNKQHSFLGGGLGFFSNPPRSLM